MARARQAPAPNYRWAIRVLAVAALILAYSLFFGSQGIPAVRVLEEQRLQRTRDTFARIHDNARLRERLHALRHDDRTLEEEARSSLGLVHADEVVFILPETP